MTTALTWFDEYEKDVRARGDTERLRLARLRFEANRCRETDPDNAHALYDQGWRLARRLSEPWWRQLYAELKVAARFSCRSDHRDLLRMAVENVLEIRGPTFAAYPRRTCAFAILIAIYINIDPVGYSQEIGIAIDSLNGEVQPQSQDELLVEGLKQAFALEIEDYRAVKQAALKALRLMDGLGEKGNGGQHNLALYNLCAAAMRGEDWDALRAHAVAGEQAARKHNRQGYLSGFQLWHGLAMRQNGDEPEGHSLRLQAVRRMDRLKVRPCTFWYHTLAAWAELDNDWHAALAIRDQELAFLIGLGQCRDEFNCHRERCRILVHMGLPLTEALSAASAAAMQLRFPDPALDTLERLAACPLK